MNSKLIEKKKYTFQELKDLIEHAGNIFLSDLVRTPISDVLITLFINHSVVIRDVTEVTLIKEENDFIHGLVDIYDRYEPDVLSAAIPMLVNDNVADIVINSDIVINVLELGLMNFIADDNGEEIALNNKYLVEIYTNWHTQLHYKDNVFFELFT